MKYFLSLCREKFGHKESCKGKSGKYLRGYENMSQTSSTKSIRKKLTDYEFVQTDQKKSYLGKGSYGSVRLVREKASGKYFALKIVSKKQIYEYKT